MKSGLVTANTDSVIDFVKRLDDEEKRAIRTATFTGLAAKAKANNQPVSLYLKAREYIISMKGVDSGNGVSSEFTTKVTEKEYVVTNVDSGDTFVNGLKANKKGSLDRGSVVDFLMGVMPSFVTKKKNVNVLYEPSSGCPKDFKIKSSELGGLYSVFNNADEQKMKDVREDLRERTEYHEVLCKSAPKLVKVEATKNKNGVPILKTHVMNEMKITSEKAALGLMKNVDKIQHPKGNLRNFCEEKCAYGIPLTTGQMKVISAINDHSIPDGVKTLHLYTKDTVFAYAFRNRYPNVNIVMLGDRVGSIDKAKFTTMTLPAMKRSIGKDVMRISFDRKSVSYKEVSDAFSNGKVMDEYETELDSLYTFYSRYKSVFCMGEEDRGNVSFYTSDSFVVVGTGRDKFTRLELLAKYINMKIYKYLYLYIWTPMAQKFPLPQLSGRYQSKLSEEEERMFTRYFDSGNVSEFLSDIGDDDDHTQKKDKPLVKNKKKKEKEEDDSNDMFDSLGKEDSEED